MAQFLRDVRGEIFLTLGKICVKIICCPVYDIINFDINLSFLMKSYKIFVINRICVQYYSNVCIPFSVKQMSSLTGEHHDKPTQDFQNKIISKSIYQLNDLYTLREKQPKLSNV